MSTSPPLTIGIDARAAAEVPAGRGRVVRELLRALAAGPNDDHHYVLYARQAWEEIKLDERFRWHTIAARDPWWHLLTARAANRECDVLSSLPEVGGDAVEYVDPRDVTSIADGLRRVLCDESRRGQLSLEGVERAREFSWESFAQRVLEVLQAASSPS